MVAPSQPTEPAKTSSTPAPVNGGGFAAPTPAPTPVETAPVHPPTVTNFTDGATLTVRLTFQRAGTSAANQSAVWIENADGELVKTLYVSNFTANGGYRSRPESLATWVSKANPADMGNSQVDAVSSATTQSGAQNYRWNGTDETGAAMPAGDYHVFVEGTMYWTSSVLYSGTFAWGGAWTSVDMTSSYTEPNTATNKDMITQVSAEYTAGA